jgi:hypothetical protein
MVGVHSVSGGSTTMAPGVGGELTSVRTPRSPRFRHMLTFTAIETGTQTNIK